MNKTVGRVLVRVRVRVRVMANAGVMVVEDGGDFFRQ